MFLNSEEEKRNEFGIEKTKGRGGGCRTLLDDVEDDVDVDDEVEVFDVDVWLARIIVQSICSFLYRTRISSQSG